MDERRRKFFYRNYSHEKKMSEPWVHLGIYGVEKTYPIRPADTQGYLQDPVGPCN